MTRAITAYKAYGIYIDEPITTRAWQVFQITFTQANSDLTMDLADVAGTFWAEADADATGLAAKNTLSQILTKAGQRVSWSLPAIDGKKNTGSTALAATDEFRITTTGLVPSFLFFTAGAPTAGTFTIVFELNKEERAVRAGNI